MNMGSILMVAMTVLSTLAASSSGITKKEAIAIAENAFNAANSSQEIVLLDDKTLEKSFGWVFFATSRKYLETKDPKTQIPGLGPLIVEKRKGETLFLPSKPKIDQDIKDYEKKWNASSDKKRKI